MPKTAISTCALDCPDACSVLVTLDADGRATRLRGNPAHPTTQGFLCAKVTRYLDRVYHPDRLLHPLKRTSAGFERVSWNEALDAIAARLQTIAAEDGPEAILPYSYAGTMGYLNGSGMDRRFFHRLGASRLDRTICASAGAAGLMEAQGARLGIDPRDFVHARFILVWGANILATNVHQWPFIVEARRQGAKLVVIDPVRTKTAALADQHLAPYPGSDLALALGLIHVILRDALEDQEYLARHATGLDSLRERAAQFPPARAAQLTGIPAHEIEQLARAYATASPAAIRLGYGVQRSERGGRAVRAIALLPALTGAWRHAGGGLLLTTSGAFEINRDALERPDLQPQPARVVNMSLLGDALTRLDNPPVKAIVVYNSNPAAIAPDQARVRAGFEREDLFKVVIEQFMTDTARHADFVLPATTFLEHTDLYFAYGHYEMQLARPALAPPGEARSNVEIFRALARRMGFTEACFADSDEDMIRAALDSPSPYLEGITLERLEREHSIRLNVARLPFAEGGFRAASGKCDLSGDALEYTPPVESRLGEAARDGRYPLELISHKSADGMNSTFGNRAEVDAQCALIDLHPEDAAARNIADGAPVEVFNGRGAVRFTARVNGAVRPGVVRTRSVRWGQNVNLLISQRLTDIGGGPTFYNCLVDVRPCSE
ncbi:MAG: molybdopterin-dependent oxidoreductase [Bryobacteraceae bacterium]|nr:molybdopterin-dependent oxidoreductase [Bryobacteraceae bacterium]